jgi:hypothetical protein
MSSKKIQKDILNHDNKYILIGILTILVTLWSLLYLIPGLLSSLFNTILGNLILVSISLLLCFKNIYYGLISLVVFIILIRTITVASVNKEGFRWTKTQQQDFIVKQQTMNPGVVFDTNILQTQTTPDELEYFSKNGYWPWSERTKELYIDAANRNPITRQYPEDQMSQLQTIYNEKAILQVLSQQTKEGQFLINGVEIEETNNPMDLPSGWGDFPYTSGLMRKRRPIVKCNMKDTNNATLEKITPTGYEGILNSKTYKKTDVDLNDLEQLVPGFKFLKGKCNPCSNINKTTDYSCPFELDIKDAEPGVSNVWDYLWFNK